MWYLAIFGTGVCQSDVVPRSLPIFKRFITILTKGSSKNDADLVVMQARSCLSSIMRVLEHAKYVARPSPTKQSLTALESAVKSASPASETP